VAGIRDFIAEASAKVILPNSCPWLKTLPTS